MAIALTASPALDADVYLIPAVELSETSLLDDAPPTVNGRPVTAVAPHPELDDLTYVTTGHPESLSFLPDPYVEFD
jgi:hypothetical protein